MAEVGRSPTSTLMPAVIARKASSSVMSSPTYATHDGRQVCLGVRGKQNESAAWRAWELLRSGQPFHPMQPPTDSAPVAGSPASAITVQGVIDSFLADAKERVSADTLSLYRLFLTGFAKIPDPHLPFVNGTFFIRE